MSYKHLTIKEREILMFLRAKGLSIRAVALRLGRNPSTISRELKRCAGNYSPSKADNDYHQKRQNCHKKRLLDSHPQLLKLFITSQICTGHQSRLPLALIRNINGVLATTQFTVISINTIQVKSTPHVVIPVFSAISDINIGPGIQRILDDIEKYRPTISRSMSALVLSTSVNVQVTGKLIL